MATRTWGPYTLTEGYATGCNGFAEYNYRLRLHKDGHWELDCDHYHSEYNPLVETCKIGWKHKQNRSTAYAQRKRLAAGKKLSKELIAPVNAYLRKYCNDFVRTHKAELDAIGAKPGHKNRLHRITETIMHALNNAKWMYS